MLNKVFKLQLIENFIVKFLQNLRLKNCQVFLQNVQNANYEFSFYLKKSLNHENYYNHLVTLITVKNVFCTKIGNTNDGNRFRPIKLDRIKTKIQPLSVKNHPLQGLKYKIVHFENFARNSLTVLVLKCLVTIQ